MIGFYFVDLGGFNGLWEHGVDPVGTGQASVDEIVWVIAAAQFIHRIFFANAQALVSVGGALHIDQPRYETRLREEDVYVRITLENMDVKPDVLAALWDRAAASTAADWGRSKSALLKALVALQREALEIEDIPVVFTLHFVGPTCASVARSDGETFDLPEIPARGADTRWVADYLRGIGALAPGQHLALLTPTAELLQDSESILRATQISPSTIGNAV